MARINRRIVSPLIVLAALVGVVLASSGLATANAPHYYAVVVGPNPVPGGATSTVTATFNDESAGKVISADVFLPPTSVMTVSAPSLSGAGTATVGNCTLGGLSGPCVRLRGLTLTTGQFLALNMTATTAPSCTDVTGSFNVIATQSEGLDDKYGNPNPAETGGATLDGAHSILTTTVHDTCHLAFASQPANAIINQTITGTAYTPSGPAETVDVLDMGGTLVTSSTAPITVSLQSNSSSATLAGTLTQNAVGGVATFGDLSVNVGQDDYTLGAANTADPTHYAPATSSTFTIAQQGTACTGSCTLTSSNTGGSGKVVASPTTTGGTGTLVESANIGGQSPLVCTGSVNYDPNTYEIDTVSTTTQFNKVFTITIVNPAGAPPYDSRDRDTQGPSGDGDNDYDDVIFTQHICFQAPYPFTQLGGTPAPGSGGLFTGLLPACPTSGTPVGPCDNRRADALVPNGSPTAPHYNIVLQAVIPPNALGDPRMH